MTEAAAAGAGGKALTKVRLRRVPTSLFVTLLGIALTAWLLPAFTRQWDDRQKAQEVKAGIVATMGGATAQALSGGEKLWDRRKVDTAPVIDEWAVRSLTLETRLRAYFGPQMVAAWEIYSWLVARFDDGHGAEAEGSLISATRNAIDLDPAAADAIAEVLVVGEHEVGRAPHFDASPRLLFEQSAVGRLRRYLAPNLRRSEANNIGFYGAHVAEFALLDLQAELAREIVDGHVRGYSTTGHDLLHDLIPFA